MYYTKQLTGSFMSATLVLNDIAYLQLLVEVFWNCFA